MDRSHPSSSLQGKTPLTPSKSNPSPPKKALPPGEKKLSPRSNAKKVITQTPSNSLISLNKVSLTPHLSKTHKKEMYSPPKTKKEQEKICAQTLKTFQEIQDFFLGGPPPSIPKQTMRWEMEPHFSNLTSKMPSGIVTTVFESISGKDVTISTLEKASIALGNCNNEEIYFGTSQKQAQKKGLKAFLLSDQDQTDMIAQCVTAHGDGLKFSGQTVLTLFLQGARGTILNKEDVLTFKKDPDIQEQNREEQKQEDDKKIASVLQDLVFYAPELATIPNSAGDYPLTLAMKTQKPEVIELIVPHVLKTDKIRRFCVMVLQVFSQNPLPKLSEGIVLQMIERLIKIDPSDLVDVLLHTGLKYTTTLCNLLKNIDEKTRIAFSEKSIFHLFSSYKKITLQDFIKTSSAFLSLHPTLSKLPLKTADDGIKLAGILGHKRYLLTATGGLKAIRELPDFSNKRTTILTPTTPIMASIIKRYLTLMEAARSLPKPSRTLEEKIITTLDFASIGLGNKNPSWNLKISFLQQIARAEDPLPLFLLTEKIKSTFNTQNLEYQDLEYQGKVLEIFTSRLQRALNPDEKSINFRAAYRDILSLCTRKTFDFQCDTIMKLLKTYIQNVLTSSKNPLNELLYPLFQTTPSSLGKKLSPLEAYVYSHDEKGKAVLHEKDHAWLEACQRRAQELAQWAHAKNHNDVLALLLTYKKNYPSQKTSLKPNPTQAALRKIWTMTPLLSYKDMIIKLQKSKKIKSIIKKIEKTDTKSPPPVKRLEQLAWKAHKLCGAVGMLGMTNILSHDYLTQMYYMTILLRICKDKIGFSAWYMPFQDQPSFLDCLTKDTCLTLYTEATELMTSDFSTFESSRPEALRDLEIFRSAIFEKIPDEEKLFLHKERPDLDVSSLMI